ncbi:MAG: cupin domain-containing protein, partial [bacterium]|nr:cupin domain-containing protein [bacterium]
MKIKKNVGLGKQWLFNDGSVPIQLRIIAAEEIQPVEHIHKTMHEYFYVLQGNMTLSINGDAIEMNKD